MLLLVSEGGRDSETLDETDTVFKREEIKKGRINRLKNNNNKKKPKTNVLGMI